MVTERPQDKLKDIGPIARLLGAKWVRRDEHLAILKVPRVVPRVVMPEIAKRLEADYRFAWPDATPRLTIHGRLIRIEWR